MYYQYESFALLVVFQFTLSLPYKDENIITYLQPGVEYCVTVSAKGLFNSNPVPSKPYCAFTSPPPSKSSNARTSLLFYCNTQHPLNNI